MLKQSYLPFQQKNIHPIHIIRLVVLNFLTINAMYKLQEDEKNMYKKLSHNIYSRMPFINCYELQKNQCMLKFSFIRTLICYWNEKKMKGGKIETKHIAYQTKGETTKGET